MARMPELSLSEISDSENPSSESISSWVRIRSAPPLVLGTSLAVVDHRRPLGGHGISAAFRLRRRGRLLGLGGFLLGFERDAPFGGQRILVDVLFLLRHVLKPISIRLADLSAQSREGGNPRRRTSI